MRRILPLCVAFVRSGAELLQAKVESADGRYQRLSRAFVEPCCYSETLAAHRSREADQARAELRVWIAAGRSDQQIRDSFVERYGPAMLIAPDSNRARWLFIVPTLFTLLALAIGALTLRRLLRAQADAADESSTIALFDETDLEW